MTHQPESDRFLRAAVKNGLRLQQAESDALDAGQASAGLRTLQRIKASLKKQPRKGK